MASLKRKAASNGKPAKKTKMQPRAKPVSAKKRVGFSRELIAPPATAKPSLPKSALKKAPPKQSSDSEEEERDTSEEEDTDESEAAEAPGSELEDELSDEEMGAAASATVKPKRYTKFEIIAGSYERFLYGLEVSMARTADQKAPSVTIAPIFQFPAHLSCIKAVAASEGGQHLATGSTDETIKIWDLRHRKEVGHLVAHEGSLSDLIFPSPRILISTASDAQICLFRTRDWALLRSLKGHKGRINSLSLHPNGRILLSVGQDKHLRVWDILGKGAGGVPGQGTSTHLGAEADLVRWSPKGDRFVVILTRELRVYSVAMQEQHKMTAPARFLDALFYPTSVDSDDLLVACDDGKIKVFSSSGGSFAQRAQFVGHTNRVKSIKTVTLTDADGAEIDFLVSISSDGKINIYSLDALSRPADVEIAPLASFDTKGSRLTCLTVTGIEAGQNDRRQGELVGFLSQDEDSDDSEAADPV
ncbi:uncharacterized protein L969DRAFT_92459 [Mixia osmundae IAM 14324]|uniref:Uncharacterized protein n=1 Tax=Mixia osmundae (strain CBS 9802 / IAM 14324 / JCM 22182 / KY 12970) TaxID=764103 RepID=G7DXH2_MIXOS|nr:uncharacterized protein L969DRAFT_92459 [Mixia osmundae IAM 14324]KEI41224.1 hypothetical protein L969DRAFT_92459 [Mixia osmundae IAM 14324]GAA95282.1 hypothetical protein E5Q_01938 [Mixia osmundae IAM 14324]